MDKKYGIIAELFAHHSSQSGRNRWNWDYKPEGNHCHLGQTNRQANLPRHRLAMPENDPNVLRQRP